MKIFLITPINTFTLSPILFTNKNLDSRLWFSKDFHPWGFFQLFPSSSFAGGLTLSFVSHSPYKSLDSSLVHK